MIDRFEYSEQALVEGEYVQASLYYETKETSVILLVREGEEVISQCTGFTYVERSSEKGAKGNTVQNKIS